VTGNDLAHGGDPRQNNGSMSDDLTKRDAYAAWRNRDFRFYALSWFSVTFGKQIETLAISVYFVSIFDRADASLALGMIGLVQAMPVMLLAIVAGQIADHYDRRRVMMLSLLLGLMSSTGLLSVILYGASTSWIFLLLGIGAVGQALGGPSRASLLPQLVPTETFPNAVAWNSSVFYMSIVTGPAVAGFIMTWAEEATRQNPAPALIVVLACRLIAIAAISLVRHRQAERPAESISWKSVVAGIHFVWNTKLILATITLDLFAVLLGGATYLLPIFAKDILHVGNIGLGLLRAADAVGAVSMAMLLAHMPPMRRAGVTLLWAVAGFGAATVVFGLSEWFWLSLLMMFLVGAFDNISVVVRHTLVQMLTPDEMRGRVSAVNGVFIVASNDLGGLESGLTAWLFGPVVSVVGGGVGTILVVIGAASLWPQLLALGSLSSIKPMEVADPDEERP